MSERKYAAAIELVRLLAEDDADIDDYIDNTPPELVYADLQEDGYEWERSGWYTREYLAERRQAEAGEAPKPVRFNKRAAELEKLRQWNQTWGKQ